MVASLFLSLSLSLSLPLSPLVVLFLDFAAIKNHLPFFQPAPCRRPGHIDIEGKFGRSYNRGDTFWYVCDKGYVFVGEQMHTGMHPAKTLQSWISKSAQFLKYTSSSSNFPMRVSVSGYDCCITKRRPHGDFFLFVSLGVIMVIRNRNWVLYFSNRGTARDTNSPFSVLLLQLNLCKTS